jgi:hypothetical protein
MNNDLAIQMLKEEIEKENLNESDYCIIIYEVFPAKREVRFIYKNFQDFSEKMKADCQKIDEDNGIYLEWRTYE